MKKYAIVSYNMYCNFTNYGSALQTYALHRVINELCPGKVQSVVLDYCPDVLRDKDILDPVKHMWDSDEESRHMVELTMPAIRINYEKFHEFYKKHYKISSGKYTSENFHESYENEALYGYVCGSDTIWCILEFHGFDDGYFGNYPVMKKAHTVSYAASFGDAVFDEDDLEILKNRLSNFKAIGIRENSYIDFVKANTNVLVQRVLDPTLLLRGEDYEVITAGKQMKELYILLYARRYNKAMEQYADALAKRLECRVVEISLRAVNEDRHVMRYGAGVEEFLSLVKHAEFVVTNSFHGVIFSIQMHRQYRVFSREQADTKIDELLGWLGLEQTKLVTGTEKDDYEISYDDIEERLTLLRAESKDYLRKALETDG